MSEFKNVTVNYMELVKLVNGSDSFGHFDFSLLADGTIAVLEKDRSADDVISRFRVGSSHNDRANRFLGKWEDNITAEDLADWDFGNELDELEEYVINSLMPEQDAIYNVIFEGDRNTTKMAIKEAFVNKNSGTLVLGI
jgi:hypothetical protein